MNFLKYLTPALIVLPTIAFADAPPKGNYDYRLLAGSYVADNCSDTLDTKEPENNVAYVNTPLEIIVNADGLTVSSSDESANDLLGSDFNAINRGPNTTTSGSSDKFWMEISTTVEYTTQTGLYKQVDKEISAAFPKATPTSKRFQNLWRIVADADGHGIQVRADQIYVSGEQSQSRDPNYTPDKFLECHFRRVK